MYAYRKKKFPVTAWLIPLCIVLIAAAAVIVDYINQHIHVSVFGQSIDAQTVRQIMVVPSSAGTGSAKATYSVNGHKQIIDLLRDLSTARPVPGTNQTPSTGKEIENVYIELQNDTWHLTLFQAQQPDHNHIVIQYREQFFTADASLLQLLQKP